MRHRPASRTRPIRTLACVTALAGMSLIAAPARADGGWGPEPVQVTREHRGLLPSTVVPDNSGGVFVVWHGSRGVVSRPPWDVYAQRLTVAGEPAPGWDPGGVLVSSADSAESNGEAIAARDGEGGLIVIWRDLRNYPWHYRIQRLGPDGARQWQAGGVPLPAIASNQVLPAIASDGDGGVVIAWLDDRALSPAAMCPRCHDPPPVWHVFAQRVGRDGRVRWEDGVIVNRLQAALSRPVIRDLAGAGTQVIWSDGGELMRSNLIDGDGASIGDPAGALVPWPVGNAIFSEDGGRITALAVGIEGHHDVVLRKTGPAGEEVWPDAGVMVCDRQYDQTPTGLMSDGAGGAIVFWQDQRALAQGYDIFAQHVRSDGSTAWGWQGLRIVGGEGNQKNPTVFSDGAGGAMLTWIDDSAVASGIYARRITNTGSLAPGWPERHVEIARFNGSPLIAYSIADGFGGATVMWQLLAGGSLYAQHIDAAGHVGDDSTPALAAVIDIVAEHGDVRARWYVPDGATETYDVERSHNAGTWKRLGGATAQGRIVTFVDRGLVPGRYGYRLRPASGVSVVGEAWIEVPIDSRLRLAGFRPNPARQATEIEFELPAGGDVVFEVFDANGRRVASRDLGFRSGGAHRVAIGDARAFGAGVFWLRISHPAGSATARGVIVP